MATAKRGKDGGIQGLNVGLAAPRVWARTRPAGMAFQHDLAQRLCDSKARSPPLTRQLHGFVPGDTEPGTAGALVELVHD